MPRAGFPSPASPRSPPPAVVLDWADATGADLNQLAQVPPSAAALQPNPFGFRPGDRVSVRDALCCAMMGSDNIAAESLAWHVGADLMARTARGQDPYAVFIKQMNALAANLGMDHTRFLNPHGLDNAGSVPRSTAADMARLTLYALRKPAFVFYTSQRQRKVTYQRADGRQAFLLKNTNEIVGRNGIDGVKTGTTARAGQCLILSASKKPVVVKIAEDNHEVFPAGWWPCCSGRRTGSARASRCSTKAGPVMNSGPPGAGRFAKLRNCSTRHLPEKFSRLSRAGCRATLRPGFDFNDE